MRLITSVCLVGMGFYLTGCEVMVYDRHADSHGHPHPAPPPPAHTSHRPNPNPPPPVHTHERSQPTPRPSEPWVNVSITTSERQAIRRYVQDCQGDQDEDQGNDRHSKHSKKDKKQKHKELPPGLAKKAARGRELPPGWQDKVTRGCVMPAEVYEHCHPLPRELTVQLPSPPRGTVLVAVDGRVVRLMHATKEILDVFEVGY